MSDAVGHLSSGEPLASVTASFLEPRFGHSLADVRVHADAEADQLARGVRAEAFTAGHDIFFRAGRYHPSSTEGMRLLAHEAAHTIQQEANWTLYAEGTDRVPVSDPADDLEVEADRAADRVVSGVGIEPVALSPAPAVAGVQRQEARDLPQEDSLGDAWNFFTNNVVSGGISMLKAGAEGGAATLGGIGDAATSLFTGGLKGGSLATGPLPLQGGMQGVSVLDTVLGPINAINGFLGMQEAAEGNQKADFIENYLSFSGGASSTLGALAGWGAAGAEALGLGSAAAAGTAGTGAAGALSSAAGTLGPLGAVLGAGAGGFTLGKWLAQDTFVGEGIESGLGLLDKALGFDSEEAAAYSDPENPNGWDPNAGPYAPPRSKILEWAEDWGLE